MDNESAQRKRIQEVNSENKETTRCENRNERDSL